MKNRYDYTTLARKLYYLRDVRGWSIAYVAELLDCSTCTVHMWESGKYAPQARYIAALCDIYNVSADWLLGLK